MTTMHESHIKSLDTIVKLSLLGKVSRFSSHDSNAQALAARGWITLVSTDERDTETLILVTDEGKNALLTHYMAKESS